MKLNMTGLLFLLSVCGCASENQAVGPENPAEAPRNRATREIVRIEFRRAERAIANGLQGMTYKLPDGKTGIIFVARKAEIVTADIKDARVGRGPWGQSRLEFRMKPSGVAKLRAMTQAIIGRQLVVLVRGKVLAAVDVQGELGESIVVEGAFSAKEALGLANELELRNRSDQRRARTEGPRR